ncbi:MAG: hypothetical protein GX080_08380 [Tissierellia bacterium]|nr:hypothetical protein [Tissierellia bacterium]
MSEIIFLIVTIMVIEAISKTVKDKRKIQQERMERRSRVQLDKVEPVRDFDFKEVFSFEEVEEEYEDEYDYQYQYSQTDELEEVNKDEANSWDLAVDNKVSEGAKPLETDERKVSPSQNKLQRDVLRGIVFSEILSEPKSLQNIRKGM